jgi:AcrR family transcriptional regulator
MHPQREPRCIARRRGVHGGQALKEATRSYDTVLALDTDVRGMVGYQPIGQMPDEQDTRKRLVQAAVKLFAHRGYYHTSIADILRESDCKRGTLYHYFSSKEELGYAAIDETLRLIGEQGSGSHLQIDEHPIDRLLWVVDSLPNVTMSEATASSGTDIAVRMASVHEGFRKRLTPKLDAMLKQGEEITRRGVADGQIADSVDPAQLTHLVATICAGSQIGSLLWEREAVWENAKRWLRDYLNSLRK